MTNGMKASAWYLSMNSIIPLAVYAQVRDAAVPPIKQAASTLWKRIRATSPSICLLYTSPSPRDAHESRMPSSA